MLYILIAILSLVIYVASIFAPVKMERFAKWLNPYIKNMEEFANRAPGIIGLLLRGPFWASRKSLHKSKDLGRKTHEKLKE